MNVSMVSGFLVAIAITYYAVTGARDIAVFGDTHAIVVVIGGTIAASIICFPIGKIITLLRVFTRRLFSNKKASHGELVEDIVQLSQSWRQGKEIYESHIPKCRNPFLRDAAEILLWKEMNITDESIRECLETRAETHYELYTEQADSFRTMAKFPPAFGLMGTTLAMITLLQSLGGDDVAKFIGPAMAIGLVATFYGIAVTNFILVPIAENLTQLTKEDLQSRRIVVEGVMLIHQGLPAGFVKARIESFLLPNQRMANQKKYTGEPESAEKLNEAA